MVQFPLQIATKTHLDIIKRGLDHISNKVWEYFKRIPYNFYVKKGKPTSVFLIHQNDISFIKRISEKELIMHSGIFMGYINKGEFFLSLEGAEFIYFDLNEFANSKVQREQQNKNNITKKNLQNNEKQTNNILNLKKLVVSEQAAKSFMYGNNLQMKDVVKKIPKKIQLNRKDIVFILDSNYNLLGIGLIFKKIVDKKKSDELIHMKYEARAELKKNIKIIIQNLVDYGYYIRRGY
ncbi:MAG: hypothetical protein ACTSRZ_16420 [Promethearchaeota archaeon]